MTTAWEVRARARRSGEGGGRRGIRRGSVPCCLTLQGAAVREGCASAGSSNAGCGGAEGSSAGGSFTGRIAAAAGVSTPGCAGLGGVEIICSMCTMRSRMSWRLGSFRRSRARCRFRRAWDVKIYWAEDVEASESWSDEDSPRSHLKLGTSKVRFSGQGRSAELLCTAGLCTVLAERDTAPA